MAEFILGVSLGQASEFSAICVLEQSAIESGEERPRNRYGCRFLKRWPLGTTYPTIVSEISKWVGNPPLRDGRLILDGTVVGRPVVDLFRKGNLPVKLEPVTITGGQVEALIHGWYQLPKHILISGVQVLLQERRLQFARSLPETHTLVKELHNYRLDPPKVATDFYDPRQRQNDDLVLALALACWWGERRKREMTWWV